MLSPPPPPTAPNLCLDGPRLPENLQLNFHKQLTPIIPALDAEAGGSLNVPGLLRLHKETLSPQKMYDAPVNSHLKS